MRCPKCEMDCPTAEEFTVHLLQEVLLSLVNQQAPMTNSLGHISSAIMMKVIYDLMRWQGTDFEPACLLYLQNGAAFNRVLDKFNAEREQMDGAKGDVK